MFVHIYAEDIAHVGDPFAFKTILAFDVSEAPYVTSIRARLPVSRFVEVCKQFRQGVSTDSRGLDLVRLKYQVCRNFLHQGTL